MFCEVELSVYSVSNCVAITRKTAKSHEMKRSSREPVQVCGGGVDKELMVIV